MRVKPERTRKSPSQARKMWRNFHGFVEFYGRQGKAGAQISAMEASLAAPNNAFMRLMNIAPLPSAIGKYRIDSLLGEGAMGVVYRAYDTVLERPVALKTLRKALLAVPGGEEMLARFRREASAGSRLSHKHVVTVYDFGEDEQQAYMAMEFIDGQCLRDLNARRAPWPLLEALELAHQLLEALDFFHARGVVHRDIKPANIMVDEAGTLTVTDFGIARMESSDLTQVGTVLGTPSYMSPEQITGEPIDGRSDLFAVGVILFEMLTATRPFRGELITLAHHIVCTPHPDPSTLNGSLPPAIDQLFQRALAKQPADRFANGAEFREALGDMLAAILAPTAEDTQPPCRKDSLPPAADQGMLVEPTPSVPVLPPAAVAGKEGSVPRRSFNRCPKCTKKFETPLAWNAICPGCGAALFEAAASARGPLSGRPQAQGWRHGHGSMAWWLLAALAVSGMLLVWL